ncbi:hypothetical protein [Micromonospora carbonacea]|uniref:Uncharacterized protein n=1 Tax=Micromonospora carbonacea TaxID=47853 RepID=A0A1C5AD14_9ACTN|nr:hypothetical protein [Micromonospora carbonacea]SCF43128.1 hypothetical protein GA0070563_112191 [Micromonospora carbonacea]
MIDGDTSLEAAWWLFGPLLADWWQAVLLLSVMAVTGAVALVNLAVGRLVPPAVEHGEPGEVADTVPLPRPARSGGSVHASYVCAPADDRTVVLRVDR